MRRPTDLLLITNQKLDQSDFVCGVYRSSCLCSCAASGDSELVCCF